MAIIMALKNDVEKTAGKSIIKLIPNHVLENVNLLYSHNNINKNNNCNIIYDIISY